MQIVFQISNYFHYDGGPTGMMELGLPVQIDRENSRANKIDFIIIGSTSILCLYCLFLFVSRTSETGHLYFSLLCLVIFVRVTIINWHILDIIPGISDSAQNRFDYLTLFAAPPVYFAFVQNLFPGDFPRSVFKGSALFAITGIISLILPTWMFTHMREPAEAAGALVTAIALFCSFRSAWKGRDGALFTAVSTAFVLLAVIYDILHRARVISGTRDLFPFGIILLICTHSVVLGRRFSTAFNTSEELSSELRQLNRSLEQKVTERTAELERMATTDSLTGLHNRRSLINAASIEWARSQRHGKNISVLMIDVDHFKEINDTHGHHMGDEVLRSIGNTLRETLRAHDIAGRYGGEEFAVILPELSEEAAVAAAERIRNLLESQTQPVRATVSIGVAAAQPGETLEQVLNQADQALYASKSAGRNRVTAFSSLRPQRT